LFLISQLNLNLNLNLASVPFSCPLSPSPLPAITQAPVVAGALFATHPIHAEAVASIVGRAEGLCAVFSLLSFHLHAHVLAKGSQSILLKTTAFLASLTCFYLAV